MRVSAGCVRQPSRVAHDATEDCTNAYGTRGSSVPWNAITGIVRPFAQAGNRAVTPAMARRPRSGWQASSLVIWPPRDSPALNRAVGLTHRMESR